jgi:hypothetical protein
MRFLVLSLLFVGLVGCEPTNEPTPAEHPHEHSMLSAPYPCEATRMQASYNPYAPRAYAAESVTIAQENFVPKPHVPEPEVVEPDDPSPSGMCDVCGGSGRTGDGMRECPACAGTGKSMTARLNESLAKVDKLAELIKQDTQGVNQKEDEEALPWPSREGVWVAVFDKYTVVFNAAARAGSIEVRFGKDGPWIAKSDLPPAKYYFSGSFENAMQGQPEETQPLKSVAREIPSKQSWFTDLDEALTEAREKNKVCVVFWSGKFCVPCNKWEEEVLSQSQVSDVLSEVIRVKINTDDETGRGSRLADRWGIESTPSITVVDPGNSGRRTLEVEDADWNPDSFAERLHESVQWAKDFRRSSYNPEYADNEEDPQVTPAANFAFGYQGAGSAGGMYQGAGSAGGAYQGYRVVAPIRRAYYMPSYQQYSYPQQQYYPQRQYYPQQQYYGYGGGYSSGWSGGGSSCGPNGCN